jgi:two-component system, OmpR family, response regulator
MIAPSRILLVDDEEEFVSALSERMETRGFKVDAAVSGKQALKMADGTSYDAVFLDLAMPEMDGLETLEQLLKLNPDLQVILLTGQATVQKAFQAIKMGAMDLLEKPARLDLILERIREAQIQRVLLVEKRNAEKISSIITKKGW